MPVPQSNSTNHTNPQKRFHSTPWLTHHTNSIQSPTSLPTLKETDLGSFHHILDLNQVQLSLSILQMDPADRAVVKIAVPQSNSTNHTNPQKRFHSTPWLTHHTNSIQSPTSLPTLKETDLGSFHHILDLNQVQLSLSILQMDPADRAVVKIADRRDAIQKKAFTNWVNHHLSKVITLNWWEIFVVAKQCMNTRDILEGSHLPAANPFRYVPVVASFLQLFVRRRNCWVQDLFIDLRTGYLLVRLLEILTDEVLGLEYIESRLHWIQNVQRVLNYLRYRGIRIVNIRADEIVDGNPKLTLGLIWIIILHFQLTEVLQNQPGISTTLNTDISVDEAARQSLLAWCRSVTAGYPGVFVRDFSDSWRDGRAFLAILHRYRPELVDFQAVDRQSANQNLELAFNLALRELQVARLFDAEDLAATTDERSIMTYVASLYESLVVETPFVPPMPAFYPGVTQDTVTPSKSAAVASSTIQSTNELNSRWTECRTLATDLAQWLRLTTDQMSARNFPPDLKLVQQRVIGEIKRHRLEDRPRRERERQQLVRMYEELKPAIRCGKLPNESFLCIEQINRLWGEYDLALQERELAARSEAHRLDRLQWAGNRATRECKAVESQLVALELHVPESNSNPADLTDGQPERWNEQLDVVENKLNGLFNQVQHLRTGRYVHTEQIYRDVCTLHQRFLDLKRRFRERVISHGLNGTKIITQSTPTSALNRTPSSAILQHIPSCHGDQKYEFLTPIQRCLAWIDEHTRTVLSCRISVKQTAQPPEDKQLFEEALRTVEDEYQQLLIACDKRARFLRSLMDFVRLAEQQLLWIRDRESCEVSRDWSHYESQLKSNELRTYLHGLMQELKQHEITFSELSVVGSSMILENHPAVDLVQAYLNTLERHWAWLFQLLGCTEARLEQLSRRETLYQEATQCETSLNKLLDNLRTQFGPSHRPPNKTEGERLRKQLQLISVQVDEYEKLIAQLIRQAQELLPLTLSDSLTDGVIAATGSLDQQCVGLHVHPLCCFRSADYWSDQSGRRVPSSASLPVLGEVFWPSGDESSSFDRSDSLILVSSAGVNAWKLRTPNGTCLQTPTVCFLPSWPCPKAIDRTKQLASLVNHVKSCLALVDLHLKGQLLHLSVNEYRQSSHQLQPEDRFQSAKRLYIDQLRHLLALRLANQPANEIDQFETDLNTFEDELRALGLERPDLDEETNEQHRQLVDHLRQVLDALTCRLQQSSATALPNRVEELEQQIKQHKAWTQDLSRVRAQCLDFDQLVTSTGSGTDAIQATTLPSIAIQSQALCDAIEQLHIAGQSRARLLADADAWLARLTDVDHVLNDCELRLFGCAVHNHGLLPSDGTLEVATHDGLRAMSVEQAHKDLKAVAERLPRLHTELDLLTQQLPDLSKLCSLDATTGQSDSVLLGPFMSPVNTQLLDATLAVSYRRLATTMREVEQELKLFGDSLRHFSAYQSLHEQLTDQLTQLAKRAVGVGELARSVGLESGPDHSLTQAALVQAEEIIAEVDSRLEQVEALNQHVTQLVSVLTSYAQLTQAYRHLVETTFQKSGGYRDYRWSPGFGLFDLPQVLKHVDQITDQYNSQAQYVYDQVHNLYQLIRNSGYTGRLHLSTAPQAKNYRQLYPGEWPREFTRRSERDLNHVEDTDVVHASPSGAQDTIPPVVPHSTQNGTRQIQWELRLGGIENEPIVLLPSIWRMPPEKLRVEAAFRPLLNKPMPTSGAWFVTRLADSKDCGMAGEPLCIGDALRCGLIDPRSQTCQQSSMDRLKPIGWDEAVERGLLTEQAVRVLREPMQLLRGQIVAPANCLIRPEEFSQAVQGSCYVDFTTGRLLPDQHTLVESLVHDGLSTSAFSRLAALLASGICVEFRDSRVSWYDSKGLGCLTQSPDMVKPCLSDWLTAGAYNPVTRRLRVSVLKSATPNSTKFFSEDELTIQRAIDEGLIDPNVPEIVVPMDSFLPQATGVPYRRITLAMSISLGLLDQREGMWCGIAQWADVSVGLESAYAAGLISRAPTLSEAVLSGLLNLFTQSPSGDLHTGLIDAHTGDFLSISEAVQRGLLLGSRLSLMLLQGNKVAALTLNEALDTGLLNEFGQFVPPDRVGDPVSLWDAVNLGLVRLIHTEVFPPPVGILQPKNSRNQQYHQHPIIQAIRTNLLDATSERILLSEAEARQLGLTPEERRVPLRNSPRLANLCDAHSVHLLTAYSGLSYPDGRELTGLDALARGWLKPCSNTSSESKSFGELIDPSTDLSVDVNNGSRWPPIRPLSTSGAQLLLGLSSNRPECGYLVTRRLITKLTWLGPGLHDDKLIRRAPCSNVPRFPSSTKPSQTLRVENIVAVIDPISGNRLTPDEAVGQHLLDLDLGLYRDPVTGQSSGINEAVHNGRILVDRSNSNSAENVVLPADLSLNETRTYRIVSVMDPVTGQLVSPDRAIAAGLLDLRARLYTGTQPSISIDEARQRGFVLAHGISQTTDWTPELDIMMSDETRSSRKPPSLVELIHTGRIIQHPDKRCLVHVPAEARFISLEEAVSIGQLDPDRSLVKNSSTGRWCNLPKAFSNELVDGISGYVNLMPGWISILDAASRGLLSESTSSSLSVNDGPISFDDALDRGLIDPVSSQFRKSSVQSGSCDPTTVSVQEAIERGWLESPAKQKKSTQNGSSTGIARKRAPSPGLMSVKTPLSSLRKLFRSQSPGKISTLSDTSDGMDTSFRSGRVELSKPERNKLGSASRFLSLFSTHKPNQTDASSNQGTLRRPRKAKPHVVITLQERNCVLYAFYYLHDEVRVEAAITDTMLREGRINLRNATVCHPVHGRFVPISEALTNGFVFGIVFTRGERSSQLNMESEVDAAPVVPEPVFWLEVFHHRHDIYQLERVYDPYDKRLIEVEDALSKGIIDPIHCTYTHPVTGDLYSVEDALYCGWIQALPVGNPPPFEPERNTFDHIHVRTVEEGFTFTTITRTIPLISPTKTGTQPPSLSIQSNGVRTTMSLKRHLPGEPLPQFHPALRIGISQPVYHLKPGFQFTPQGDIQDISTKNCYSVVEAIARKFVTPLVSGDKLPRQSPDGVEPEDRTSLSKHPRFSPNLLNGDVRYSTLPGFNPSMQVQLTDNSTAPVLSLSLVRYQQSFNVPAVQGQPKTWLPRYITLETAIKRGWLDPVTGQLHTQSGRTTKMHLLEAVEQGIIDPVQILVRFVQPMESDLQLEALYGDEHVTAYYSLATVLEAATYIYQTAAYPTSIHQWRNSLMSAVLHSVETPITGAGTAKVKVEPSLSDKDYKFLEDVFTEHNGEAFRQSVESVDNTREHQHTKLITADQAMHIFNQPSRHHALQVEYRGSRLSIAHAIELGLLTKETPIVQQPSDQEPGLQYTTINNEIKLVFTEKLHAKHPAEVSEPMETKKHMLKGNKSQMREENCQRSQKDTKDRENDANKRREAQQTNKRDNRKDHPKIAERKERKKEYKSEKTLHNAEQRTVGGNKTNKNATGAMSHVEDSRSVLHAAKAAADAAVSLTLSDALAAGLVSPASGLVRVPGTDRYLSLSDAVGAGVISGEESLIRDPDSGGLKKLGQMLLLGAMSPAALIAHAVQSLRGPGDSSVPVGSDVRFAADVDDGVASAVSGTASVPGLFESSKLADAGADADADASEIPVAAVSSDGPDVCVDLRGSSISEPAVVGAATEADSAVVSETATVCDGRAICDGISVDEDVS
ncbi:hypothetical protein P879_04598, partial [Paragonimus westermani]